jgi:predicted aminopeptidase
MVLALVAIAGLMLAGRSTLSYYAQAGWGGLRLLARDRSIEKILAAPEMDSRLRKQLEIVLDIREFASRELRLPDNGSYRRYVEVDGPYVTWIVVAAPQLSLEPMVWCFPIAGCVSYRGYFSPGGAQRFAETLRQRGYDVTVSGVRAFSTIGWFKDPVLSTFVFDPPASLAGVVFHELAHQRLYVKNDTRLNESFATVVESEGVRRWLERDGRRDDLALFETGKERQRQVLELLSGYRDRLATLYDSAVSDEEKRRRKRQIFADLETEYRSLEGSWGQRQEERQIREWNNADLVSVEAYHHLVPPLRALLAQLSGDLEGFYQQVSWLAELSPEERQLRLAELEASGVAAARP